MRTINHHASGIARRATIAALAAAPAFMLVACNNQRVDPRAELEATEGGDVVLSIDRETPERVRVGEEFEYEVTVNNDTDQALHNVVLKETVSGWSGERSRARVTEAADRSDDRKQRSAEGGSWDIGYLGPYESETITVTGIAHEVGEFHTCMLVDYDIAVCETLVAVAPDLQFRRNFAGDPDAVYACDDATLVYTLTNDGRARTRPVTIREPLPRGVTTASGARSITLNVGSVAPGDSVKRRVDLEFNNDVTAYASTATANNGSREMKASELELDIMRPTLAISADGPATEYVGRSVTHTFTVENTSDDPAIDVVVRPDFGSGASNVSFSSQRMERADGAVRIGDLDPGESRTASFTFDTDAPGALTTEFEATAYCAATKYGRVTTDVEGIPAVLIEVIDKVDPIRVSEETIYQITVTNQGTAPGIDIRLRTELPGVYEFVGVEGDRGANFYNGVVTFDPIPRLAPGESETWDLTLRAAEAGRTRFEIEMASEVTKRPIIEQESTTIVE